MRNFILFILLSFLLISAKYSLDIDTSAKIKAMFIYSFARYIEWPPSYKKGDFLIGVLGNPPLYDELLKMSRTKKIYNQNIKILKFNNVNEITNCHILFIPRYMSDKASEAIKKVSKYSTLVITEKEGLISKGAGINFVIKDHKQNYELGKTNILRKKLKVSNTLETLAISVK